MSTNLLTEVEAKTKECRVPGGYGALLDPPLFSMCSASACMHWRDGGRAPRIVERTTEWPAASAPDTGLAPGWVRNGDEYVRNEWADVGYCGLAGKP